MSIERGSSPVELFGKRVESFHYTGEIDVFQFVNNLSEAEQSLLTMMTRRLYLTGKMLDSELNILVVGSSANLTTTHVDIDLLVVPEKHKVRGSFPSTMSEILQNDSSLIARTQYPKGSAINWRTFLWSTPKLFVSSNNGSTFPILDVTFAGKDSGSVVDFIDFHKFHNLAFCRLDNHLIV